MTQHYLFGFLMLIAGSVLEVSSRPSTNEPTTVVEFVTEVIPAENERSLAYDETNTENEDLAKEILEKIKAINDGLKRPNRRQQTKWNIQPQSGGGYIIDKEILETLQQVIASGKIHTNSNAYAQQQIDDNQNEEFNDIRYSRQMASLFPSNQAMGMTSVPYMMNLPVLVVPSPNMLGYPNMNQMGLKKYQNREDGVTSPFEFQWPFASLFPVLIRDPLLTIMNGGGWNQFIEYGQNADVCKRKQKIKSQPVIESVTNSEDDIENDENIVIYRNNKLKSRQKRAVKKRTVAQGSKLQNVEDLKKIQNFFTTKASTTTTPKPGTKTKDNYNDNGDLRFPFSEFTFFGNRKPVAPSPGFFINRMKVHRGGVAIAGPGGVATAGRGGTAIVGPGGLAYTQPGGVAVAGPAARVVALSPDADLTNIVSRLQAQTAIDGSVSQLIQAIPEGKVVATGPVIYYHPNE